MLLDYVILLAVTAFTATNYLAAFWAPLGRGARRDRRRARRSSPTSRCATSAASRATPRRSASRRWSSLDIVAAARASSSLGLALFFDPGAITDSIHLGTTPTLGRRDLRARRRDGRLHRAGVGVGPVGRDPRSARRGPQAADRVGATVGPASSTSASPLVAMSALPVVDGRDRARRQLPRGADARRRRRVRPALAARRADAT